MSDSQYPEDTVLIRVSKLAAATRQLNCAIDLWFSGGDAVSIHALAAAAHQIIHDLHDKRCPDKELLFDASWIKDEKRAEFINIVKDASNSFKHADRTPDKIAEFTQLGTLMFFMISAQGLQNLGETLSPTIYALTTWLALHRPQYANPAFVQLIAEKFPVKQLAILRSMNKREYFHAMLQAAVRFPAGKWAG